MKTTRLLLLLAALSLGTSLFAQQVTLVPFGSTWRYRDNGSDQGTAWRAPAFVDTAWAAGPAQLGYGDGDEATVTGFIDIDPATPGTQVNATTYFRSSFNVPNPAAFPSLRLTLLYDDAGAVYLNGTEVARTANLPANAAYDTYATATSVDNATQTWTIPSSSLVAGTNTLAVEIHQAAPTSSDISFDLELTASPQAAVSRGPYLQQNHAAGITLRWRTNLPTDSVVWTSTTQGTLAIAATNATPTTEHEVALTGLPADTKYFYAVGSTADGMLAGNDPTFFFLTAPVPGTDRPTRIWVLGDCGRTGAAPQSVRDAYFNSSSYRFNDIFLLLGDNAYDSGLDTEYQNAIFNTYPTILRQSPVWSCLGNHETAQASSGTYAGVAYFDIFSFPTNAEVGGYPSGTERYFSWEYGNIHFISLDTQTTDANLRTNMLTWLDNDLAANTRRWTIAVWHHPAYTKGSHNSDAEEQLIWARTNLVPKLESAGVDLVLSGHSHSYERSKFIDGFYATPTFANSGTFKNNGSGQDANAYTKNSGSHNGTVYAVPGSAGQISGGSLDHPVMFTSLNELGSLVLDISGRRLDAKFINSAGATRDYFTIDKTPSKLVNISTRLRVEQGDNTPIAGFIVTGTQPKKVIVRALGPSLAVNGNPVAGRVADTTLELVGPGGTIMSNDNWRTTQQAEIIASLVPPTNDLESAIVATLPASANGVPYTAVVRGKDGATGVGQVEVYDLDAVTDSQLANISTRGLVQTGDNVVIGGIILTGPTPRKVIVRAIGPSLSVGGSPLPTRLMDPTLEIRDANGALEGMNDNWRSTQEAEIIATGVPPSSDQEAAIVATLPASVNGTSHTAIVRGKNDTVGVALVEVFGLN